MIGHHTPVGRLPPVAGPLALRFLRSASSPDQLPDALVEVALVGRSNVGKSSLLNALANRTNLARTSKTPGATRLLNVFELEGKPTGRWVVDLPGYGFAKVSGSERASWQQMIEGYLTGRPNLQVVLLLVDAEIGPTPLDVQTVDWLRHIGRPIRIVATKADKVGASRRGGRRAQLASGLGLTASDVAWCSAEKGFGIPELRTEVTGLLTPT